MLPRPLRNNPLTYGLGFQHTRIALLTDLHRRGRGHHPRHQQHARRQTTRSNNTG